MSALLEKVDPIPSWQQTATVAVGSAADPGVHEAVGIPVGSEGEAPASAGVSRQALGIAGFTGEIGTALLVPSDDGVPVVVYGIGVPGALDAKGMRDSAAAFARAVPRQVRMAIVLPDGSDVPVDVMAQAAVEGSLLARYRYTPLKTDPAGGLVESLTLLIAADRQDAARDGARRGAAFVRAAALARDLANCPPSVLTAARMADCASAIAAEAGLQVEVFDRDALLALGCGGLLGVNAGSADPPRMLKLRYRPAGGGDEPNHLTLVGKGIMYDSGGISLKPADAVHATMKNDMSGAGAILAAMAVLKELQCPTAVTGFLMCTDNMPSGTATKLGDVLSIRGGTTVEVINTDAEGRLVMADALVLATEEPTGAIVDIATLTGACLRALGAQIAGVFGNDQPLVDQVMAAADTVDEPVWQLPLARRYRKELDSDVADIKNMGGPNGAAIHAALFLEAFVAGKPWAHIDIAGPAQIESAAGWMSAGCSGFGARLLAQLALTFRPPQPGSRAGTASRDGGKGAAG